MNKVFTPSRANDSLYRRHQGARMRRLLESLLLASAVLIVPAAQTSDQLLSETRLSVHTLLREDVFGGYRQDNLQRLARAERHIEILLKDRPAERGNILAWKAGAGLYRAVRAHEAGQADEFERRYAAALSDFTEAGKTTSGNGGVAAITGGTLSIFADRLPPQHRSAAWALAYDSYAKLWKEQGAQIDELPVHHKGEVLSGLTQAAQRTGRTDEAARYLDRMLVVLAGTPYEATAKQWKADPAVAATTSLTCKNCHTPGRLLNQVEALRLQ
jgi:hypothetical protein